MKNNKLENILQDLLDSLDRDCVLENTQCALTTLALVVEKNTFTQPEGIEDDTIKFFITIEGDNYTLDKAFLKLIKAKLLGYLCDNEFPRPEVIFALSRFYDDNEVLRKIIEEIKFKKANNKEIILTVLKQFDLPHFAKHRLFLQSLREFPDLEIVTKAHEILTTLDDFEAKGVVF